MLTKKVRIQVTAFIAIALIGIAYTGARYAGLDTAVGGSGYSVGLRLADSGGIFTHAQVTYRGVGVGRVGELRLTDDGIEVDLNIDAGAPPIPADVHAVVANRSAVGEQFVDLRPRTSEAPYLEPGSVIAEQDASTPLSVETVLLNLDKLIESVPIDDLRTVVDEIYLATQGIGPHLQSLLDTSAEFTVAAQEHLDQTTGLITDAEPVLRTQIDMSNSIKKFGSNAKLLAAQLRESDGDLRRVLAGAPGLAREVSGLINETGAPLGELMANLLTTSEVVGGRKAYLEQLLDVTPKVVGAASNVITKDGARIGLVTTFFDPPPCGYGSTTYRNGLDTSPAPFNTAARC